MQVDRISTEQIADLVSPHWQGHGSTGYRILQKCVTIFEQSFIRKLRPANPARAARQLMPKVRAKTRHFRSVPHAECGDAVMTIREACRFGVANARLAGHALEMIVLTVVRTGEILDAEWDEFDLERELWAIPGERMKGGLDHRVPLSRQALDVPARVRALRGDGKYAFGYREAGKPRLLLGSKMSVLMRKLELSGTPRGIASGSGGWTLICPGGRVCARQVTLPQFQACSARMIRVTSRPIRSILASCSILAAWSEYSDS